MKTTLQPDAPTRQLAPRRANRDGVHYETLVPAMSSTAAGARQQLANAAAKMADAAVVLVREGHERELNRILRGLDEVRCGGADILLTHHVLLACERYDAADEHARAAYMLTPSLENARALMSANDKAIDAMLTLSRALRCTYPEFR